MPPQNVRPPRVAKFLQDLCNDPDYLARYRAHPNREMAKAGLNDDEQNLIREGSCQDLEDTLAGQESNPGVWLIVR